MKASERLRLEASLGNNVYNPWPMVALREAADLLDECESVIATLKLFTDDASVILTAERTLAKLRANGS